MLNSEETPLGKVICVGSGKGGVGKDGGCRLPCRNLGRKRQKTLLCDFAMPYGTADMCLEGGERAVFDLSDFALRRAELSDVAVEVSDNLFFAAAGKASLSEKELADCVRRIDRLCPRYDFIVADCPVDSRMTVEKNFSKIISLCVTQSDSASVRAAAAYAGLVSRLSPSVCKFVLNGFCREKKLDLDLLTDSVGLSLCGNRPRERRNEALSRKGRGFKTGNGQGRF